ncbi:MAG TPA: efflux RND transporter periplasmic adaptor subunit, partial [Gemmatimonadaceae bacterium]|nr:efflux RND transporter periplasmic adaptor subunit [Gemmatimonadaceae bacterium]
SSNEESVYKSAIADLEAAKADLSNAQWNSDQAAELFRAGAIPERDWRAAQQTVVAAQARVAAAESRLRGAAQALEDTRVRASTSGMVAERNVEAGERVSRGSPLFTLVRTDVLELVASVPARFAAEVHPDMPVRFTAGGLTLVGRVARVSPTVDPASRSVRVYLQVPNKEGRLKGNTFATGQIIARSIAQATVIPIGAIRYSQGASDAFVYRIAGDVIEYQPVDLGIVDEVSGLAQVTKGLEPGDRVVVGNVGPLGRGMRVQLTEPPEQTRTRPMPRP